ncbi:MAG: 4'-phosphopantetheinyl transferase family protein [Arthrobacter sp.]|uniref:4'-phosphopantetheinyl transferase family protein n=1 Tax=unclassified Arthrobacter TaxID=235627 RepID=UPI002653BA12|nr:4'-phosphopantetheinyl transferase superfamily protein [Micrococcaceae bacterium]MDN5813051.1 4'-phosphopantetheinyl transferase superfamily protein [Micrococcaceae bacterium]MDN5823881.1 4'-phosphopantetheinyl transferase superfamily protein [Micrococcaceae bacterium]MDN5879675.1 4'-phosphopantetheinyl transferase superfamily protein [Micrococcaceae bacterium]MDN5887072.1 4'-phosphopantetheinyl transferase superfamily protein [Micrococcaceae bacterium]
MKSWGIPATERQLIFLNPGPLRQLLPSTIQVSEIDHDPVPAQQATPFSTAESTGLTDAVEQRRSEFLTTRRCAHEALATAGAPPAPLMRGPRGEPQWPAGWVGSLTHIGPTSAGRPTYRAAAVAAADRFAALGIDAEEWAPLPHGTSGVICTELELRSAEALFPAATAQPMDRLVFSIKESFYKARFPLTRTWLDFLDVEVDFGSVATRDAGVARAAGPMTGTFSVAVSTPDRRHPALPDVLSGRFLIRAPLVVTAVMLER